MNSEMPYCAPIAFPRSELVAFLYSRYDWLIRMPILIGQSKYFGVGFKTRSNSQEQLRSFVFFFQKRLVRNTHVLSIAEIVLVGSGYHLMNTVKRTLEQLENNYNNVFFFFCFVFFILSPLIS